VLKTAAQRLTQVLSTPATVARMGGDEFALLLPDIGHVDQAREIAARILAGMSEVMIVEGHRLHLSASVGVAFFPDHGADLPTLLRHADAALYDAKSRGRDTVSLYDPSMSDLVHDENKRRAELRQAIANQEFVVHYQPLVEAATGKVRAVEALVRWQDPEHGLRPPADFISLAEQTGLIVPIGAWVLQQACADLQRMRLQRHPDLKLALNLSPRQLAAEGLESSIRDALEAAQLPASALELEITETALMESLSRTRSVLTSLRAIGVGIAIDDFGTGYSSLSYLAHLPVQTVKIDRSFVQQIDGSRASAPLVGAIVSMAHSLGLAVVAEGVETLEQHLHLAELGCELLQGYRFSKPVALDHLHAAIALIEAMPTFATRVRAVDFEEAASDRG
jgi:predicted signal transduction protein with EAL and GGDEF domain